ncbi:MAG: aminotransferase class V-fold PLP-dependent enzyme, partial [Actinobacteria bacterium]|nr:aminotransferase class V-fold PLP-dependent enzyme [Actinomycetota bacterium]
SREAIADAVGASPSEVIFTASGTEANNLALKGFYWHRLAEGRNVIATSPIEHHAILDPLEWLVEHENAKWLELDVDQNGQLLIGDAEKKIRAAADSISFISIMHSNNEVGSVQHVGEIAAIAGELDLPIHTDAVQSFGKIPLSFRELNVTAMSLSAHKIGGPLGIGALVLKKGLDLTPVLHGGGQERDLRSGTLDTPAIAGFAAAATIAIAELNSRAARVSKLRERLISGVLAKVENTSVNSAKDHLPGIAHFTFEGAEGDALLLLLDAQGVQCSTGSACSAGVPRPSHVLLAMGMNDKRAKSSLRFSIGPSTTEADIDLVISVIAPVVKRARAAGLV